jgi:hypothetical protein
MELCVVTGHTVVSPKYVRYVLNEAAGGINYLFVPTALGRHLGILRSMTRA